MGWCKGEHIMENNTEIIVNTQKLKLADEKLDILMKALIDYEFSPRLRTSQGKMTEELSVTIEQLKQVQINMVQLISRTKRIINNASDLFEQTDSQLSGMYQMQK